MIYLLSYGLARLRRGLPAIILVGHLYGGVADVPVFTWLLGEKSKPIVIRDGDKRIHLVLPGMRYDVARVKGRPHFIPIYVESQGLGFTLARSAGG